MRLINAEWGLMKSVTELYILLGLICLQRINNSVRHIKCLEVYKLIQVVVDKKKVKNKKKANTVKQLTRRQPYLSFLLTKRVKREVAFWVPLLDTLSFSHHHVFSFIKLLKDKRNKEAEEEVGEKKKEMRRKQTKDSLTRLWHKCHSLNSLWLPT